MSDLWLSPAGSCLPKIARHHLGAFWRCQRCVVQFSGFGVELSNQFHGINQEVLQHVFHEGWGCEGGEQSLVK